MIHERADGTKIEYRRASSAAGTLCLESRVLRRDGTPHPDGWYPVGDAELVGLQQAGSDIVALLGEAP